jgi:DNA-binding response OmpR family regulator
MNVEKIKILLVDDDEFFGFLVKKYLEEKDFLVDRVVNAKEGYELFCKQTYHLCLLDVMMPDKDGFALAREIKAENKTVPFIFITGNKTPSQTLVGFDTGADDYIKKPFAMEELLVRMKAILRRRMKPQEGIDNSVKFNIGNYIFNYSMGTLIFGEKTYRLTTKETELLYLFALKKNELVDRSYALKVIWNETSYLNRRSMDVFVTKLRKYFVHDNQVQILNIPKQGYMLQVKL